MANHGFVYFLSNKAMPGIFKIGMTDRSPWTRCDELSSATAIPYEFDVIAYIPTTDAMQFERELHEYFAKGRCSPNREFFRGNFVGYMNEVIEVFGSPVITESGCDHLVADAVRHIKRGEPPKRAFHDVFFCCRLLDFYPACVGTEISPDEIEKFFKDCANSKELKQEAPK